jgi:hypothetical protein
MARSRKGSVQKVVTTVLFAAFGLVALAITYRAVTVSTDQRSKAAEGEIVKSWEFNTNGDTEGWSGKYIGDASVSGGYLQTTVIKTSRPGRIRNLSVGTTLETGNKYITLSMAVTLTSLRRRSRDVTQDGQSTVVSPGNSAEDAGEPEIDAAELVEQLYPTCIPVPRCTNVLGYCPLPEQIPVGGYCPPPRSRSFTYLVFYRLAGKQKYESKPLALRGVVDGRFHDYTLKFPEIGPIIVDRLNIQFVRGVSPGDTIQIDWVRLLSNRARPTSAPTPPPGCFYQQVECVKAPCEPVLVCPTPTGRDRVPSPTPPHGCYYQNVQCIQAPCNPILICPTPTCRPRPPRLDAEPRCLLPETEDMCPPTKPTPASGCYYQQVQCVKAPCEPILVCPTRPPSAGINLLN